MLHQRNVVSPYSSRQRESDPQGEPIGMRVLECGASEGRPVMGRIGTEPTTATSSCCESKQTSTWSFFTRSPVEPKGRNANDFVARRRCALPRGRAVAQHRLGKLSSTSEKATDPYRRAPVTGHQFQQSLRLYPLWEWGLLSALPQGRKTTSGPEHGMRRENAGSSKSACFPEQS